MYNLISNAFKYSPSNGNVSIEIKTKIDDKIQIRVKDTGTGITNEEKEFIFERFYRTTNDRLKNTEGSGIGLSLTRDLIELYGGSICVESEPGSGATFIVNLPDYKTIPENFDVIHSNSKTTGESRILSTNNIEAIEVEYQDQSHSILTETQLDKNKKSILIVEDNPGMLDYIIKNISTDYNVIQAENGKIAIEKCELFNPDIIVSDIMMPVMDGVELCKTIKTDIRFNHIPVILLTAKIGDQDQVFGFEAGADDYILKPFNPEILNSKLHSVIKNIEIIRQKYANDIVSGTFKMEADSSAKEFLGNAIQIVENNISNEDFGVDSFAKEIGMGRTNFYKKIKTLTGYTVNDFIKLLRLKRAEYLLINTKKSISEIQFESGFNDGSYFATCFQKQYGLLPSEYREERPSQKKKKKKGNHY